MKTERLVSSPWPVTPSEVWMSRKGEGGGHGVCLFSNAPLTVGTSSPGRLTFYSGVTLTGLSLPLGDHGIRCNIERGATSNVTTARIGVRCGANRHRFRVVVAGPCRIEISKNEPTLSVRQLRPSRPPTARSPRNGGGPTVRPAPSFPGSSR